MKKITFFSDPGHGWLAVPMEELEQLGIVDRISHFSYIHGEIVYLEEDDDASVYLDRLKEQGVEFEFNEVHQENTPIRDYRAYHPEAVRAELHRMAAAGP